MSSSAAVRYRLDGRWHAACAQPCKFVRERIAHLQQRRGNRLQCRMTFNKLADPCRIGAPRRRPGLRPKPRRMPRMLISMSWSLPRMSMRAVSRARTSWAGTDLQWTDLNQPSRINCAMPRASFLSVFTGIVLKAARTCRVSISSTARPLRHPGMEPLRQGTGLQTDSFHCHAVIGKPGDQRIGLAQHLCFTHGASRTMRPSASTTHTLEYSNGTSIPACCFMVASP